MNASVARDPAGRRVWPWPTSLAVLAVATYAISVRNGFALDDVLLVRDDPRLVDPEWFRLILAPYWTQAVDAGLYRPLTTLSFALNRAWTGAGAAGFHAVNVALHGMVTVLVWAWTRRVSSRYGTALVAGALFATHPIHAEVVANIAGRAELLAAGFVLTAGLAHARARDRGRRSAAWAATAALAWGCALLSKEHAVLGPAVFLVDDMLRRREGERPAPAAAWIGYGVVALAYVAMRHAALGGFGSPRTAVFLDNPVLDAPTPVRIATALWVQVRYVGLTLWPWTLSSDYSWASVAVVRSLADPRLLAGTAWIAASAAAAARGARPVVVGVVAWWAFALPSSNLPFPVGVLMAERLLYLPSVGACLSIAHVLAGVASRGRRAATSVAVAVGLLATGFAVRSAVRAPDWRDNATLALADVDTRPDSAKLQAGAAIVLHDRGDLDAAERHYRRALAIWPDYAQAHYNFGVLLRARGRDAEAIAHWRRSAMLAPDNPLPVDALVRVARDPATPRAVRDSAARALRELGVDPPG